MEQYIERAIRTLADSQQSSFSKHVAKNALRDVGFSEAEIRGYCNCQLPKDSPFVMVA